MGSLTDAQIALLADKYVLWDREAKQGATDLRDYNRRAAEALKVALELAADHGRARDWSEFEDDISDAISDSIDMDWTSRDGARAVIRLLNKIAALSPEGKGVG